MKYNQQHLQIGDIKAESLLLTLFPDLQRIDVEMLGIFGRNYQEDITEIHCEKDKNTVFLSRDSVFHILPEGLFFDENRSQQIEKIEDKAKKEEERKKLEQEIERIKLFFNPFDNTYFQLNLEVEKEINRINFEQNKILLNNIFDIFSINIENPYIKKAISLLPFISEIRGNKWLMKDFLKHIFYPAKIQMEVIKPTNTTSHTMKIIIHKKGLSAQEFIEISKETDVFAHFFYEWFMPIGLNYEFKIKDMEEKFVLGKTMTLDYNTFF